MPELSIIIVLYQGRDDLERCLPSIYAQDYRNFELVMVDNCPGDGTAAWLEKAFPKARIISNAANTGYAGGNNLGFRHARGEWLLVLNPDTKLHPSTLKALIETAKANPDALITPKLLNPDGTVNACGNHMHYTGITTCRGLGENPERYQGLHSVPLLSGAAFIASREALLKLGSFDEDYFMYLEDADLSLRARAQGYEILCAADAVITHHYSLGMSPTKFHYLERNRLLTLLKVYSRSTLFRLMPALILTEVATWAFALLKGPRYLIARWQGYAWIWRYQKRWRAKRTKVQEHKQVDDELLLCNAQLVLPFNQLVHSPRLASWLGFLTRPLYRLAQPRLKRVNV